MAAEQPVRSEEKQDYIEDMKGMHCYRRQLQGFAGFLLLSLVTLGGCHTVEVVEHPDAGGRWTYRINITRPNTENEGKRGALLYRGREPAVYFSSIIIGGSKYDYLFAIEPGDFSGYIKEPGYKAPTSTSSLPLKEEELRRGWYFAPEDRRRSGTPAQWIWVKRENIEAFVDPDKLYRFSTKYGLIPESDQQKPPIQFGLRFGATF
jgi:hypothetical protein